MIPKIIHCVWLSGETKPELYQDCIDSWQAVMPDYEVKEWSLKNLPKEVLDHPFVKGAIDARKWAFATDYIRLWALYTFGGVYMDTDVYVYRKFDPFLNHRAFGCVEFIPSYFYKSLKKKKLDTVLGLNVDAAILGSEKGHKWISDLKDLYDGMIFRNDPKYYKSIIMPVIMSRVSLNYGFKYVPSYQVLKDDIHLYPADVFAYCYAPEMTAKDSYREYGDNQIRYACHMCAHYNTPRFSDRHNYGGMTNNRYICKKEENQNGKTIEIYSFFQGESLRGSAQGNGATGVAGQEIWRGTLENYRMEERVA